MLYTKIIHFCALIVLMILGQACSRAMLEDQLLASDKIITELKIYPSRSTIESGSEVKLTVIAVYADSTYEDVTAKSALISLIPSIASVQADGTSLGLSNGTGVVSAVYGGSIGRAFVNVTHASLMSIEVTPGDATLNNNVTQHYVATGIYSDTTRADITEQVSWMSLDANIASISDDLMWKGIASTKNSGTTVMTASWLTDNGSTNLTVGASASVLSISITPVNSNIALSGTVQYYASALYSDGTFGNVTSSVAWTSSVPAVASISNLTSPGRAVGLGAGVSIIKATLGSLSVQTNLTVNSATLSSLQVISTNSSGIVGSHEQFRLMGTYSDGSIQDITELATWSSSNAVAVSLSDVNGSKGYATAIAVGTSSAIATINSLSASKTFTVTAATLSSIQVLPSSFSLSIGVTRKLQAIGTYSDASTKDITNEVIWSSADINLATVSNATGNNGLVNPLAVGTTTIIATSGVRSGSSILTVTNAALQTITLNPTTPTIALGKIQKITAVGHYSDSTSADITHLVFWKTNMGSICNPSNAGGYSGFVYTLAQGTANVIATLDGISNFTTLTVIAPELVSITISPAASSLVHLGYKQFYATGHYTDGSSADITNAVNWSVSNALGTISSTGMFFGLNLGSFGVTATQGPVTQTNILSIGL